MDKDEQVSSKVGKEILRQVKQRQNQYLFRKMVLSNYGGRCCVSGLPVQAALRASHIVGWAEDETIRMLPTNGLCLSATYDAVFDEHLLSFDEDYRMILSPSLHEYFGNQAFMVMFKKYEGKRMLIAIMVGMVMGARPLILIESVHSPPGAPRPPLPEGGSLGSEGQTLITFPGAPRPPSRKGDHLAARDRPSLPYAEAPRRRAEPRWNPHQRLAKRTSLPLRSLRILQPSQPWLCGSETMQRFLPSWAPHGCSNISIAPPSIVR